MKNRTSLSRLRLPARRACSATRSRAGDHAGPGAAQVLAERDEVPGRRQCLVIADLLQLADGLPAPFDRLLGGERAVDGDPQVVELAASAELEGAIAE